jgi:glutamate synthase domain-containing protein 2
VSGEIAAIRDLPAGVDQRSPARHPDFLGPDDMIIKIEELREATDWKVPVFVKMGATRVFDDVKLAVKCGADVVVVDGMEGGTGASPEILQLVHQKVAGAVDGGPDLTCR